MKLRIPIIALSACALPTFAFFAIRSWGSLIPEPLDWRPPQGLPAPRLLWTRFLDFQGEPNLLLDRLWRLSALHHPSIGVSGMAMMCWLLSTLCFFGILASTPRPIRRSSPLWISVAAVLGLGLWIFSPLYGASWLLGDRAATFAPATAAVLASVLLGARPLRGLSFGLALLLSLAAAFLHPAGVVIWGALVLRVWQTRASRGLPVARALVLWCFGGTLAIELSRFGLSQSRRPPVDVELWDPRAWARALEIAGHSLPGTLVPESAIPIAGWFLFGGSALILAVGLLHRRRADGILTTPWPSFALVGAAFCIFEGTRLGASLLTPPALRELHWSGLLLPIGVVGSFLSMTRGVLPSRVLGGAVLALALLGLQGTVTGWPWLLERRALLDHAAALRDLSEIPDLRASSDKSVNADSMRALLEVAPHSTKAPLSEDEVEALLAAASPTPRGTLSRITVEGAGITLNGQTDTSAWGPSIDSILVVQDTPTGRRLRCLDSSRKSREWSAHIPEVLGFKSGDRISAFGFDSRRRCAYPLAGSFRFDGAGFRRSD